MYMDACLHKHQKFRHSSPLLMEYWAWRRHLPRKGYPPALQQSGISPTPGCADTSIVGLTSIWCGPHTGASRGPGFWCTRSAYSAHSGRTAPGSTCSYKRSGRNPDLMKLPHRPMYLRGWAGWKFH